MGTFRLKIEYYDGEYVSGYTRDITDKQMECIKSVKLGDIIKDDYQRLRAKLSKQR